MTRSSSITYDSSSLLTLSPNFFKQIVQFSACVSRSSIYFGFKEASNSNLCISFYSPSRSSCCSDIYYWDSSTVHNSVTSEMQITKNNITKQIWTTIISQKKELTKAIVIQQSSGYFTDLSWKYLVISQI